MKDTIEINSSLMQLLNELTQQMTDEALEVMVAALEQLRTEENMIQAKTLRITNATYPVDKVNNNVWDRVELDERGMIAIDVGKRAADNRDAAGNVKNRDKAVLIKIGIFELKDGQQIKANMTEYDKRVYIICHAFFMAAKALQADCVFSLLNITKAITGSEKPSKNQQKKVLESLKKMIATSCSYNNEEASEKYGYTLEKRTSNLLNAEIIERETVYIDGKLTDVAIQIFQEPYLIKTAKQFGNQITTIPLSLLHPPKSLNDNNLKIQDYLITAIARQKNRLEHAAYKKKNSQKSLTLLLNTIVEKTNIEISHQMKKSRIQDVINTCLTFYKEQGFIKSYDWMTKKDGSKAVKIILK